MLVELPKGFEEVRVHDALDAAATLAMRADEFVDRCKPWAIAKDPARTIELETTLSAVLEVLRLLAIALWPAMPAKCEELWSVLALPGRPAEARGEAARPVFGPRAKPRALGARSILFPRLDAVAVKAALAPEAPAENRA